MLKMQRTRWPRRGDFLCQTNFRGGVSEGSVENPKPDVAFTIPRKGFSQMSQKRHSVDQIIAKLHRADVLLGKDTKVPKICKPLKIAEQTYYRWRQKYGGMQPEMAKQLKTLEKENARLKKMVAEQALDMDILKEAAKGNW